MPSARRPFIVGPVQFSHGEAGVQRNGTIFYKSVQLRAYVDDIDIIGRTMRDVSAAFSAIEREMGLAANEGETK